MYFVDCEASSLDSGSYPIEIAWVDETGQGEHYLIRPIFAWTNWKAASEAIHGISRATLEADGKPADWVAHRAATVLTGHTVVSDNPEFEEYWIGALLATIERQPLPVIGHDRVLRVQIHRLLRLNTAEPNTPDWHRQARRLLDRGQVLIGEAQFRATMGRVRHRALPDAEALWQMWRLVKQDIDQILIEH